MNRDQMIILGQWTRAVLDSEIAIVSFYLWLPMCFQLLAQATQIPEQENSKPIVVVIIMQRTFSGIELATMRRRRRTRTRTANDHPVVTGWTSAYLRHSGLSLYLSVRFGQTKIPSRTRCYRPVLLHWVD